MIVLLLQVPQVQGFIKDTAVNYLSHKLHTPVRIGRLSIDFPNSIELDHVYVADQKKDTLLYTDTLFVGVDMMGLLRGHVNIGDLKVARLSAYVYRTLPDTVFNFAYIVKAFSSPNPPKKDTAASSTTFAIHHIALSGIHLRYKDDVTGYDADVHLGDFRTWFRTFDPDKKRFSLDSILLSGVHADVRQSAPLRPDTATAGPSPPETPKPELSLEGIDLARIWAHYDNSASGVSARLGLGRLLAGSRNIDLNARLVDLGSVALSGTTIALRRYRGSMPPDTAARPPASDTAASRPWTVRLAALRLAKDHLKYDNDLKAPAAAGIDYNHLDADSLLVSADDLYYSADSSSAKINDIVFTEKSGFALRRLTARAFYTSHGGRLDGLELRTAQSHIDGSLGVSYPSLGSLGREPGKLGISADLDSCLVDLSDALYFQPSLDSAPAMKKIMHAVVQLSGKVSGRLDDLAIRGLDIRTGNRTHLAVTANIKGLPRMKSSVFDLELKDLSSGSGDLRRLLAPGMLPSSVRIPRVFSVRGRYKGSLGSFAARAELRTTDGNASVSARVGELGDSLHATYEALLKTDRLDLGSLLGNDTLLGTVSSRIAVQGSGLTARSADARLRGTVSQAVLRGYDYRNLTFSGGVRDTTAALSMTSGDANLRFRLTASAGLGGRYPSVKLRLALDSADLYALHLSADTLKFRGMVAADFPTASIDHLNGRLVLSDLQMVRNNQLIAVDSIILDALATGSADSLHLKAPFATASVAGHYALSKAGFLVQSVLQPYLGTDSSYRALRDSAGSQLMRVRLALLDHPLWQQLLPSVTRFSGAAFSAQLSSTGMLRLKGEVPQVLLTGLAVDSLQISAASDSGRLRYALTLRQLDKGSIHIHHTSLRGYVASRQVHLDLRVGDLADKAKYRLAGVLALQNKSYRFSFTPGSLLLNYVPWDVPAGNYILYEPAGIVAHDLKVENAGQYLLINSTEEKPSAPLEVSFHDFRLQTLTRLASRDTALVSGVLNGRVVATHLPENPLFTADLHIDSLAVKEQPVGNLAIQVDNKMANAYQVGVALTGDSNDLKVSGVYYTRPQSRLDLHIAIPSLNIASAQAFTFGQVNQGSGRLTGDLRLQGTPDRPQLNGQLTFKNAALNITKVNDYLRMPDETIRFDGQGIHFDHFTLIDSLNNKAVLNGGVLTTDFKNYRFNLDLTARRFRILNAKKSQDELYYGPVYVDARIAIRGTQNLPRVDGRLKMDAGSIFTLVLPPSNPEVESSEGIVEFVNASQLKDTVRLGVSPDTVQRMALKGIQVSINITVDTAAVLSIIIDPTNGDNLRVQGDANMNMTMDPSGKLSLTGRYQISKGAYKMSLEGLIKRTFDIQRGSSITWTGSPTSAILDLTAIYRVETSAMELVEDQLSGQDEATRNTYKQKLPFQVFLNINGALMKPDISFSLGMPESARNAFNGTIYTRINQINTEESEVNKQVLGLLVLGHFIAENPFETAGGGGAEQMVRESASKILSQQLNNLAGNLIQGVNINFDIKSSQNYSSGSAQNSTNLNVGISKSLFNGRTSIYVGSNFQLEGPPQPNQKSSQIAGDVAIDYKLSRDGTYRLRAYRQNKYEGLIEGQFIETGLSFIIVMDYNHFKELFESRHTRRERRRLRRQQRKMNDNTL